MGRWVLSENGVPFNVDHLQCITINLCSGRHEVRAYLAGTDEYAILFSHKSKAVCEEWRDKFIKQAGGVIPKIFFARTCPKCNGQGFIETEDAPFPPCDDCEGTGTVLIDPAEIPAEEGTQQ